LAARAPWSEVSSPPPQQRQWWGKTWWVRSKHSLCWRCWRCWGNTRWVRSNHFLYWRCWQWGYMVVGVAAAYAGIWLDQHPYIWPCMPN
jgi:hypothetical protein